MKRAGIFVAGLICGALLFCGVTAYAAGILAEPSTHRVFVNGEEVQVEGYLIDGHNYFKLRDVGQAVGFDVCWDEDTRSVQIDRNWPYTGALEAHVTEESGVPSTEEFNIAVLTGAYTSEAFGALRSAIVSGIGSEPVYMSEKTHQAMLEAEAAIGCWPVYELISEGGGMYRIVARFPEPYEEAAAYCQPFIDSLAGKTDREKVREIAFFVCDRLEYSANATSTPRTALADDREHKSNCSGYSICFKFLCDLAEIPCILAHSTNHQWNMVYVEGQWWHVNVSGADISDPSLRPKLPVLKTEDELQGSTFTQSQPWLTELAKELMVPGSTK